MPTAPADLNEQGDGGGGEGGDGAVHVFQALLNVFICTPVNGLTFGEPSPRSKCSEGGVTREGSLNFNPFIVRNQYRWNLMKIVTPLSFSLSASRVEILVFGWGIEGVRSWHGEAGDKHIYNINKRAHLTCAGSTRPCAPFQSPSCPGW
jgi:hypothetical protein